MAQKEIIRDQILSFLNADFENLDPKTPMEWLDLYNRFYQNDMLSDNSYYELFDREKILKYFKDQKLNPEIVKLKSGEVMDSLDNPLLARVYFNFIQKRFKSSIRKLIKRKIIAPEYAYPLDGPIPAAKLGKIIIANGTFDLTDEKNLKFTRGFSEIWENDPDNFEILIWRAYYKLCRTDFTAIQKIRCCDICQKYFFSLKSSEVTCSLKKCKNKRRENLRYIKDKKDLPLK